MLGASRQAQRRGHGAPQDKLRVAAIHNISPPPYYLDVAVFDTLLHTRPE